MDWVRNNKFLAGFLGVLIVAIGGVGFWLYSTQSTYNQVSQEYSTQVTELKRLENLNPYPEEANLQRFAEQKKEFAEAVTTLQENLAKMSAPTDRPLSPTDFQNRLREVVSEISGYASQNGVALPPDFYLGFEIYRSALPDASAAAGLTTELGDVQMIVHSLINRKIDKITFIKRAPLPGETFAAGPTPVPVPPGARPAQKGAELVVRHPIEISFSANPNAFRGVLADITTASRLFVTRALQIKNQVDKGPVRGQDATGVPGGTGRPTPGPAPTPAPAPAGAPAAAPGAAPADQPLPEKGPAPLRYVVGQEKLDVLMNIELLRVLPPH